MGGMAVDGAYIYGRRGGEDADLRLKPRRSLPSIGPVSTARRRDEVVVLVGVFVGVAVRVWFQLLLPLDGGEEKMERDEGLRIREWKRHMDLGRTGMYLGLRGTAVSTGSESANCYNG